MSDNMIEELEIEETIYRIRTQLPWMEQDKINSMGAAFVISGRDMKALQDDQTNIEDLEKVTLATDPVRQNYERLQRRLVGVTRQQIKDLSRGHVRLLIDRIRELEQGEQEEIEALKEGNPTGKPSND